nr:hypothetical protein [Tanacetum cinerariifolium]
MGNKDLSTNPKKESNEFIKSSVKNLVPLPSESEDTSEGDNECDLPACDECFDPTDDNDEIELLLHRDPSTSKMSIASILEGFTDEPPLKENDDLFDLESKENEWKKILYDNPVNDAIFNPGGDIDEIDAFLNIKTSKNIKDGYYDSEGYVCQDFEDSRARGFVHRSP